MLRAVMVRLLVLGFFVAFLGGTVSGQSSSTKPAQKNAPARTVAPAAAPTAIKIRTKYTSGAQVSEITTYVKGDRQRAEFPGVVSIEQCDLGQTLVLNPAAKTYVVTRHADVASASGAASAVAQCADTPQAAAPEQPAPSPRGGIVTYTTTMTDTGERKQVFGREARHITTTMTKTPSVSACDKTALTLEADGWYIDIPVTARCRNASAAPAVTARIKGDACVDKVESQVSGDAKLGFPIAMTTTTRTGDGDKQEVTTSSMEVTAFEVTTLDAALFAVPEGYTEAKSNAELMASFQGGSEGLSDALVGSTADGTSTAAPKRSGMVRIGVLEPVDKSMRRLPTRELRQQLTSDFRKQPYEAIALPGSSVADAQSQAAQMECDYVLYSEIAEIKTSKPGKVGGLFKKVSGDGPARDVDEVKLDYRLYPVGAAATLPAFSDSTKASSGGGFGLRSAVRLAMSAGSLYLRFTGLGLLNPMLMSSFGGGLGPLARNGLFDPRLRAMSSVTQVLASTGAVAVGDNAQVALSASAATGGFDADMRQTVDLAIANAAKGTMEQLRKNRK